MNTYLVCESAEHAEFVDQLVLERLREVDGAHGTGWSGVWTDGERYGILWAAPVSGLFGQPDDFPELTLADDDAGAWFAYVPPTESDKD